MTSSPALLDVEQAHARHTEFSIVDVRTPAEYASGHLPGALNVPLDRIGRSLPELRRAAEDKGLLLVCASGSRSQNAARTLAGHGIAATSLTGGTSAWSAHGHPLDHPAGDPRRVWAMERQVRLTAGSLVLLGLVLGLLVHPAFELLSAAIAGGLVFSALTDTCGMAVVLGRLPFNRRS
ncbi:rhodanese-like domain-containing protein [Streptomyces sp. ISL-66]|uniref:rhodanese-like domain-containing protein n=1 Tax=Streptomyces sp. ISL-66 TaxID=2819186 RepID=UPI001BECA43E|nr:rhodanese-like domain-containing protein [Streptomyces sp. ISL-66]MBT2470979.1 rhodanese-like domain-containing protein [Streptomyces sp. ISL-66]